MHEIEADSSRNRLYVTLAGRFDEDEAAASAERTIEATERLDPGFDVVTDIRELEASPQEAKTHLERSKLFLSAHDVGTVVRVVGDSPLAEMQFDRTGDAEYAVETAESVEAAEKLLDDADAGA
ncbi:hypothetical protein [Halorussus caseinilyticus]|uniref:Uncharacterized protein n=1 Tax=Halorussus caseinilyticus TaxID=3034025 RepID=A0ABD5WIV4_9EURY|nr:hypothetical protein [Halorussus sp. DT72]